MYGFTLDLPTVSKPLGISMYTVVGTVLSSCTLYLHTVYQLKTGWNSTEHIYTPQIFSRLSQGWRTCQSLIEHTFQI